MNKVMIKLSVNEELHSDVSTTFAKFGLTAEEAFKFFLLQVAATQTVPISFDYQSAIKAVPDRHKSYKPSDEDLVKLECSYE